MTEVTEDLDGNEALVSVVLARLIAPCVVTETGYCHDKTDQRDGIALQLFFDSCSEKGVLGLEGKQ